MVASKMKNQVKLDIQPLGGNRKVANKVSCLCLLVIAIFSIHNLVTNDVQEFTRKLMATSSNSDSQQAESDNVIMEPSNMRKKPLDEIRYAAFGTSIAWGAGLEDRTDAFLWKLSPYGSNFAIPATGAEYPSKCLSSIIGDQELDVIVLEFTGRVNEATYALARRLRQRFPDAIIIALKNWVPNMVYSRIFQMDAMSIAKKFDFGDNFIHDMNFHEFIKQLGNNDWKVDWRDLSEFESDMERDFSVKILPLTFDESDPHMWLTQRERFSKDSFHLSEKAHKEIAERVKKIVEKEGVPVNPKINDFATRDSCRSWFLTGDVGKDITFNKRSTVHQLTTSTRKYAWSYNGPGGYFTLPNYANNPQHLYISYMTTGPPPSLYPMTSVQIYNSENEEVMLDPNSEEKFGSKYVHLPREAYLGVVQPGNVTLVFRTIEKEAKLPFSLVSFTLTPEKF